MGDKKFKISVTGPESTGKSTLCILLADYFEAEYTREFAREYISNLQRDVALEDLKIMHDIQLIAENKLYNKTNKILFCDTDMINFKIWSEQVFHEVPNWLESSVNMNRYDFNLLCYPDIEWVSDAIRKNEHNRNFLFTCFQKELDEKRMNYAIINGTDDNRTKHAILAVEEFLKRSK